MILLPDGRLITVVVTDIFGDKVRLGIDAPRELQVHREEVYQAILREKVENQMDETDRQFILDERNESNP